MPLPRWWYILCHHRTSQLAWRAASIVQRRVFPLLSHARYSNVDPASVVRRENSGFELFLARQLKLLEEVDCETASGMLAGDLEFLNERRRLVRPIDWRLAAVEPVSHLWRFHLHYHEFLLNLLRASHETGDAAVCDHIWAIVADWIDANPIDQPGALMEGWHPFCLSKRIAVWLLLWQAMEPPEDLRERFAVSLESQIRYLERHLEWDLRGNHLLENLRTLALAGAFFAGEQAERRLDVADRLLCEQLDEQILPSGEHFERSPMYHAQMLSAILDVHDAVRSVRPELARTCQRFAVRMAAFLSRILHPDRGIPLLSDSALGETPCVEVLLADVDRCVDWQPGSQVAMPVTVGDYWTWRDGSDFILLDAGAVGADDLPAHAHCDLLTIEASFAGQRVFVDSGVFDYGDGEMRAYCRSTAAHNVLQIDCVEQCEMWSRFRVGYRGSPAPLESGVTGAFAWCRATHDAYRQIGVPATGRWLTCRSGGPWVCVDWAIGGGTHQLNSRLHLAPGVEAELESPHTARLRIGGLTLQVQSLTTAEFSIESGWYCPDFGVRHETSVLKLSTQCELPGCVAWAVQKSGDLTGLTLKTNIDGQITVTCRDSDQYLAWNVTAVRPEDIVLPTD